MENNVYKFESNMNYYLSQFFDSILNSIINLCRNFWLINILIHIGKQNKILLC